MRVLLAGLEPLGKVIKLIELTRITSDEKIDALTLHLVNGKSKRTAANLAGVDYDNFLKALARVNDTAEIYEEIKVIEGVKKVS